MKKKLKENDTKISPNDQDADLSQEVQDELQKLADQEEITPEELTEGIKKIVSSLKKSIREEIEEEMEDSEEKEDDDSDDDEKEVSDEVKAEIAEAVKCAANNWVRKNRRIVENAARFNRAKGFLGKLKGLMEEEGFVLADTAEKDEELDKKLEELEDQIEDVKAEKAEAEEKLEEAKRVISKLKIIAEASKYSKVLNLVESEKTDDADIEKELEKYSEEDEPKEEIPAELPDNKDKEEEDVFSAIEEAKKFIKK